MGMDLIPVDCNAEPLHYNWAGWGFLLDLLDEEGLDMAEFRGSNDGELISAETCNAVGKILLNKLPSMDSDDQEWLRSHLDPWLKSPGFRQY